MSEEYRTLEQLRSELRTDSRSYSNAIMTKGQIGSIIGNLNKALGGDRNRRRVIGWIFYDDVEGEIFEVHSHYVINGQWHALFGWIDSYQDQGHQWQPSLRFIVESGELLNALLPIWEQRDKERAIKNGQLEMFEGNDP